MRRGKKTSLVREGREQEEAGDSQREFEEHNSSTWLSLNIRLWRRYQLLPSPMPPFLFVLSLSQSLIPPFWLLFTPVYPAEPCSFTQKPIYCSFSKQREGFKHHHHPPDLQLLSMQYRFLRDKYGPILDSQGLSFIDTDVNAQRMRFSSPLLSKLTEKYQALTCTPVPFASASILTAL